MTGQSQAPASPCNSSIEIIQLAGIDLAVFGLQHKSQWQKGSKVAIMICLHGRGSKKEAMYEYIQKIIASTSEKVNQAPLIVIAFDHRNHGTRLRNDKANKGWREGKSSSTLVNPNHALDMYAIQSGTVQDVRHLMDYIPSALFPNAEHSVKEWILMGVSLGGSPSTVTLLRNRAASLSPPLEFGPPLIPDSLLEVMQREDPASQPLEVWHKKRILALCGAEDRLVPVVESGTQAFVDRLQAEETCDIMLEIEEGVGHAVTWRMISKIVDWLNTKVLPN